MFKNYTFFFYCEIPFVCCLETKKISLRSQIELRLNQPTRKNGPIYVWNYFNWCNFLSSQEVIGNRLVFKGFVGNEFVMIVFFLLFLLPPPPFFFVDKIFQRWLKRFQDPHSFTRAVLTMSWFSLLFLLYSINCVVIFYVLLVNILTLNWFDYVVFIFLCRWFDYVMIFFVM